MNINFLFFLFLTELFIYSSKPQIKRMHINFLPNYLLFKNIEKGYNTGGGGII